MKIIGIEEVQEFMDDGGIGDRCNMIVELKTKEQFRVPINLDTYSMLADLGRVLSSHQAGDKTPQVELCQSSSAQLAEAQSLEDFARAFISESNSTVPPQVAKQQDLVGQLRKVGFLDEPADISSRLQVMGNQTTETSGSDLIESFEDTSDDDDGEIAEQL